MTASGRNYTEPQKRMLKLLRHAPRSPQQLQRLIPTSASGVSQIANHLYHLIEWDHRRNQYAISPEHYREVTEMVLRWEGAIE